MSMHVMTIKSLWYGSLRQVSLHGIQLERFFSCAAPKPHRPLEQLGSGKEDTSKETSAKKL